jgi:tetratricopeptide (TPR) repeat protein
MGLEKYFQLEGLSYRLVPYVAVSPDGQTGEVNVDRMYDNLMNKFSWGGLNNPDVYLDETNTRMIMNFRNNYARLAESLFVLDRKEDAIAVLDKCVREMPNTTAPFNVYAFPLVNTYYRLGEKEKGNKILAQMIETFLDEFNYINAIKDKGGLNRNLQIAGSVLSNISRLIQSFQLANVSYEYSEIGGKYIREKGGTEEDISREDYLINTFMDEFVAAQSQNN